MRQCYCVSKCHQAFDTSRQRLFTYCIKFLNRPAVLKTNISMTVSLSPSLLLFYIRSRLYKELPNGNVINKVSHMSKQCTSTVVFND